MARASGERLASRLGARSAVASERHSAAAGEISGRTQSLVCVRVQPCSDGRQEQRDRHRALEHRGCSRRRPRVPRNGQQQRSDRVASGSRLLFAATFRYAATAHCYRATMSIRDERRSISKSATNKARYKYLKLTINEQKLIFHDIIHT